MIKYLESSGDWGLRSSPSVYGELRLQGEKITPFFFEKLIKFGGVLILDKNLSCVQPKSSGI